MDRNELRDKIWNCTISFPELDDFFQESKGDKSDFIIDLLKKALGDKNGDAVEFLIYSAEKNGITISYHDILCKLISVREDWQYKQEDIATILGIIKNPDSVPYLFELAKDYETSSIHSIPLKAMWSLKAIGNKEAVKSLKRIAESADERKVQIAMQQLEYLKQEGELA